MSAPDSGDMGLERRAEKIKISKEIQEFMAERFVRRLEFPIDNAFRPKNHGRVFAGPFQQAGLEHDVHIGIVTEGPGSGEFPVEGLGSDLD